MTSVVISNPEATVVSVESEATVLLAESEATVVSVGEAGPPGAQGIQGIQGSGVLEIAFAFGDATPKTLVIATVNKQVYSAGIHIHTPFNGTGAALSVGDSGVPSRLMGPTQNDPTTAGTYIAAPNHRYGANTQLLLTITPGSGASSGAGLVTLQIEQ